MYLFSPIPLLYKIDSAASFLRSHYRKRIRFYALGVGAVVLTNVCEVCIPKLVQYTTDYLTARPIPSVFLIGPTSPLVTVVLTLVALMIVQFVGRVAYRRTLGQETHRLAASFKSSIWDRARFFPLERLQADRSVGIIMNVATSDVNMARLIFGWTLIGITDMVFLSAFTVLGMVSVDPTITAYILTVFVPVPFLVKKLAHREHLLHHRAQESLSHLNDLSAQSVAAIRLQKLSSAGEMWNQELDKRAEDYRIKRRDVMMTGHRFIVLLGLVPVLGYLILFALMIPRLQSGAITLGGFVALLTYTRMLQGPVGEIGFMISEWQKAMASLERATDMVQTPTLTALEDHSKKNEQPSAQLPGVTRSATLAVRDLSITFPHAGTPLFSGITFTLSPGERLGIRGPTGSGKSTLISILSGLEPRYHGVVTINGIPLSSIANSDLRSLITVVPQRPFLFASTVRDNLSLNYDLSDSDIWAALDATGIGDEVRSFPDGLDSPLGEWGINLSGGQRQRLTIARAILRRPAILLLDDILSAVDTVTEDRILSCLDASLRNVTLIWSAHRESTLRLCSKFVVLGEDITTPSSPPSV